MTTAEWKCTRCGATNRKLVSSDASEAVDRCVTCRAPHVIHPGLRPTFWQAAAKP